MSVPIAWALVGELVQMCSDNPGHSDGLVLCS